MRLENGRLSDRYCIGTDNGCIVSNHIGYFCIRGRADITCSCEQVALHRTIKERSRTSQPRMRRLIVYDTGGSWVCGRRKETVTLYQHPRNTKTAQYWSLPPATDDAAPPPLAGSDDNSLNCHIGISIGRVCTHE